MMLTKLFSVTSVALTWDHPLHLLPGHCPWWHAPVAVLSNSPQGDVAPAKGSTDTGVDFFSFFPFFLFFCYKHLPFKLDLTWPAKRSTVYRCWFLLFFFFLLLQTFATWPDQQKAVYYTGVDSFSFLFFFRYKHLPLKLDLTWPAKGCTIYGWLLLFLFFPSSFATKIYHLNLTWLCTEMKSVSCKSVHLPFIIFGQTACRSRLCYTHSPFTGSQDDVAQA